MADDEHTPSASAVGGTGSLKSVIIRADAPNRGGARSFAKRTDGRAASAPEPTPRAASKGLQDEARASVGELRDLRPRRLVRQGRHRFLDARDPRPSLRR